jgi:hypothetical protein
MTRCDRSSCAPSNTHHPVPAPEIWPKTHARDSDWSGNQEVITAQHGNDIGQYR